MNLFRKIIVLTLLGATFGLNAQNYSISGNFQDGNIVSENAVLYLKDTCTFYVVSAGEKVDFETVSWKMLLQKNDLIYYPFIEEMKNKEKYPVVLDEDYIVAYIGRDSPNPVNRINSETDNSVYFQAKIICEGKTKENHDISLEFPVFLNLLPGKPTVKVIETVLSDEIQPYIWVEYNTERVDRIYYVQRMYDYRGWPHDGFTYYLPIDDNHAKIRIENKADWYWDGFDYYGYETLVFEAGNRFGSVTGDILSSNKDYYTGIQNPGHGSDIMIYPNPAKDFINIRGLDILKVESINLFDISGKLHKKSLRLQESFLNISDLPKGIYYLVIHFKDHTSITHFKFIKL
jgi:hypothetical protein